MSVANKNNFTVSLVENPIPQTLKRMTAPMILGMAMLFTFGLVDTLFISFLGTESLTAISFTFPVTYTIISLAIGLGIGTSAVVAKHLGRGDLEQASIASTVTNYVALLLALSLALVICLFMNSLFQLMGASAQMLVPIRQYMLVWLPGSCLMVAMMTGNSILRAGGDTRTPSMVMAGSGLLNALLDPLLIFGWGPVPALGITGAATATVIAWCVGCLYLFYILAFRRMLISRSWPSTAVMRKASRSMLKIGIPAAAANMMTPLAAGIMTGIAAGFGDNAVAAFGVGSRLEPLATLIVLAMSTTLPPLISQNFGAGRMDRVAEAYRVATRFIMLWQLLIYVALAGGASLIALMFTREAQVSDLIKLFIWIIPLGYGLQGVIILTNSSLNALHRPLDALYLSIARFFVFYLPLAWLGSLWFGLPGFFAGALLGNMLMALVSRKAFHRAVSHEELTLAEAESLG